MRVSARDIAQQPAQPAADALHGRGAGTLPPQVRGDRLQQLGLLLHRGDARPCEQSGGDLLDRVLHPGGHGAVGGEQGQLQLEAEQVEPLGGLVGVGVRGGQVGELALDVLGGGLVDPPPVLPS